MRNVGLIDFKYRANSDISFLSGIKIAEKPLFSHTFLCGSGLFFCSV